MSDKEYEKKAEAEFQEIAKEANQADWAFLFLYIDS